MKHRFRSYLTASGFLPLALGLLLLQPCAQAQSDISGKSNILFILDGSGSMWAQIDNRPKIDIAKEVMINLIRELPDSVEAGLAVYGHRSKGDCKDIELMSPVGVSDRAALVEQIQSIQPKGKTPITDSLRLVAEHLKAIEEETTAVLISDGKEACGGDPCALVTEVKQQGIKVTVHVVGFDVNEHEREQLMCIAEAGSGKYFVADSMRQLKDALVEVKEDVVQTRQPKPTKPQSTTDRKVIKIKRPKRPAVGTLEIQNLRQGYVKILDQETGEEVDTYHDSDSGLQLAAGTYKLKFANFAVDGIEVSPGETRVFDASTVAGMLEIQNLRQGYVKILDQETGEEVDTYHDSDSGLQLAAGTYKLKFANFAVDGIEVSPGETRVFDASTVAGMLEIQNLRQGYVKILDQETGEEVDTYHDSDSGLQLAAGTYKLKFANFAVDGIEVSPGETRVFDASTVAGMLEIQNLRQGYVKILDQETGEEVDTYHDSDSGLQLAAGTYKLEFPNFTVDDVVVEAGQTVVVE